MRRYLSWALGAIALFSSCQMYEDLPVGDNKPTNVINTQIDRIQQLLESSEHGWRLLLLPRNTAVTNTKAGFSYGGINVTFKFKSDGAAGGRVETYSEDMSQAGESSYGFYGASGIRMSFNTSNPGLIRYAKADYTLLGGLGGDIEFTVGDISENQDTINLRGFYSNAEMKLVRLTEDPKTYIDKVKDVRAALYGKALSTATIGGQQVKMSVFGLLRNLQVQVGDAEPRMLPIAFSPEGVQILSADELIDDRDASKGRIGQIGTEILRELKVEKSGNEHHVLTPSGQQLSIQSGAYDPTNEKVRLLFYPGWASQSVENLVNRINGIKYTSGENAGKDSIPGTISNGVYSSGSELHAYAFLGKTDGGDTRVSLQMQFPSGSNMWLNYFLDFAAVTDQPNQFYLKRFVQDGSAWYYYRDAMELFIDALAEKSPYLMSYQASTSFPGEYEFSFSSVNDPAFWISASNFYPTSAGINEMLVYRGNARY